MNYTGFDQEKIKYTVEKLNVLLADYHVYYQNLRNFHWNITGENFFDLHEKFEELYETAKTNIDEIAERILTLRSQPVSTMVEYLDKSEISEPTTILGEMEMIRHVLDDHRVLISHLREAIDSASEAGDEGTIDLLGGFLSALEKESWMLNAWATRS